MHAACNAYMNGREGQGAHCPDYFPCFGVPYLDQLVISCRKEALPSSIKGYDPEWGGCGVFDCFSWHGIPACKTRRNAQHLKVVQRRAKAYGSHTREGIFVIECEQRPPQSLQLDAEPRTRRTFLACAVV